MLTTTISLTSFSFIIAMKTTYYMARVGYVTSCGSKFLGYFLPYYEDTALMTLSIFILGT